MRWNRTTLLFALGALLCLAPGVQAEDEAEEQAPVSRTIDLARFRLPPAPRGPHIAAPTDILAASEEGTAEDEALWRTESVFENGTWLPFDAPVLERTALRVDTVASVLQSALGDSDLAESLDIEEARSSVFLRGPRAGVEAAAAHAPWAIQGLAPSVRVDAILTATPRAGEERLRALGGVRLWPGRWTRVYLQKREVPCAVWWDIEVAQEATSMDPGIVGVREGQELYLRYHPGETKSLVEVWAGSVEHVEMIKHDLSVIRNVPEANGPGVVAYPRSALDRAYCHVLLPGGRASRHEVRWTNEGRAMRLALAFEAPPPPLQMLERDEQNALALLRAGATAAGLEFEARPGSVELWTERISERLYRMAQQYEKRGRTFDFSITAVDGGSVFFLEAPAAEVAKARGVLTEAEKQLTTRGAQLRVLAVPAAAYHKALIDGSVRIGSPVPAEVAQAFHEAGAVVGESVSLPTLLGTSAGFRVGRSVPGLTDVDPEVAQSSAGLAPRSSARFAGLAGDVHLRRTEAGYDVRVRAVYSTARTDAGHLEITVRPPMVMAGARAGAAEAKPGEHLVKLPILGGGETPIDTLVTVRAHEDREHIVHAHVEGEEVVLLLLRVR